MSTVHFLPESAPMTDPTACGGVGYGYGNVPDRARVTCKRCLASLAKRDREFQRKARRGLRIAKQRSGALWFRDLARYAALVGTPQFDIDSARAIAREEGRAL